MMVNAACFRTKKKQQRQRASLCSLNRSSTRQHIGGSKRQSDTDPIAPPMSWLLGGPCYIFSLARISFILLRRKSNCCCFVSAPLCLLAEQAAGKSAFIDPYKPTHAC